MAREITKKTKRFSLEESDAAEQYGTLVWPDSIIASNEGFLAAFRLLVGVGL